MADKIIVQDAGNKNQWLGYIILALGLAGIIGGGYLLITQVWRKNEDNSGTGLPVGTGNSSPATAPPISTSTGSTSTASTKFPLHNGSRGQEVTNVQRYLNVRYNAGLTEDGIWGSKTTAAMNTYASTTSISKSEYDTMLQWLVTGNQGSGSKVQPFVPSTYSWSTSGSPTTQLLT